MAARFEEPGATFFGDVAVCVEERVGLASRAESLAEEEADFKLDLFG